MRVALDLTDVGVPVHDGAPETSVLPSGGRRVDWFEAAVGILFAAVSLWVLVEQLRRVGAHGGVWLGTGGVFQADQFQYMAWIRDASRHGLASNLFVLHATPHDYLQPVILISAGLVTLGAAPWVSLLVWQPVAVMSVFFCVRSFVRRQLPGLAARRTALVLALFAGWGAVFVDLWLPFWTWGYSFALLGLACAIGAILAYDRAVAGVSSTWPAALLGGLAAWLHPWEGEILFLVILAGEALLWHAGRRPSARRLVPVLVAVALPLAYYVALDQADPAWALARRATLGGYSFSSLTATLWPLAVPALLAYRIRPLTFLQGVTRAWPLAAVAVFLLAEARLGSEPMHAFLGISVPLAVLAVEGVASLRWPARSPRLAGATVAGLSILVLTIPVAVRELGYARRFVLKDAPITHDDQLALNDLAQDPAPGGVLAAFDIGTLVPADTGRHTYVGDCFWSMPGCKRRAAAAWGLLNRSWSAARASQFVTSTRAVFVFRDCAARADLARELAPLIRSVERFGCAAVYEISSKRLASSRSSSRSLTSTITTFPHARQRTTDPGERE